MKAEAHKHITINILESSLFSREFTQREAKWVVRGTTLEDWWPPRQRVRNWHFYRAEDSQIPLQVQKYKGINNPTSEDRLHKLIYDIKTYKKGSKKQLITLGRIIHHIQDMSTPSHVIPIYHDHKIKDLYEVCMMKHIDKFNFHKYISKIQNPKEFVQIYKDTAKNTLHHLKKEKVPLINQENPNLSFEKIWLKYPQGSGDIPGFGSFGPYSKCFNGEVINGDITINIEAIYKHFTIQAVQSTCNVLASFKKNYI